MTAASPVRITGPASLIDAVPYLLGFEPTDSLVLIGLRDGQVTVTARVDLDHPDQPREIADLMSVLAAKARSTDVVAVTYGGRTETDTIGATAATSGMRLLEHIDNETARYGVGLTGQIPTRSGWPSRPAASTDGTCSFTWPGPCPRRTARPRCSCSGADTEHGSRFIDSWMHFGLLRRHLEFRHKEIPVLGAPSHRAVRAMPAGPAGEGCGAEASSGGRDHGYGVGRPEFAKERGLVFGCGVVGR